jgi:prepilin-type processing-associated H-X9-DG protein
MKQIGLAMHNYHQVNDCFPPAITNTINSSGALASNVGFSAQARMLGFLEQQALYNCANFSIGCYNGTTTDDINTTVTQTRLNTFLCPSSPLPTFTIWAGSSDSQTGGPTAPGNNYLASIGSSLEFATADNQGPPNGVFYFDNNGRSTGIRDITDGTTNTIGFGETKIGSGNTAVFTPAIDFVFIGTFPPGVMRNTPQMVMGLGGGPFQQWLVQCAAAITTANRGGHTVYTGQDWAYGIVGYSLGHVLQAPNPPYPSCSTNGTGAGQNPGSVNMTSFHPGGANALMCDGSVRFLKNSTNINTIWSLGSRAQGEVIDASAY